MSRRAKILSHRARYGKTLDTVCIRMCLRSVAARPQTLVIATARRLLDSGSRCCLPHAAVNFLATKAGTRTDMSFETEKQKYLSMSTAEKRKLMKGEPTTPDQILAWPEYWSKNKSNIGVLSSEQPDDKVDKEVAGKVSIWEGDITKLEIDAIVNAANSSLLGGGGVDGAIHRGAGGYLKQECATLGGCLVGEAKITGAYMLPAKYVIHTVGPQGEKPEKLQECYENSLNVAKQNGVRTIAFPCISTGIYGYPQRPAAKVALSTVKKFLLANPQSIDRVIFCLFLKTDKDIYEELLQKYFAYE